MDLLGLVHPLTKLVVEDAVYSAVTGLSTLKREEEEVQELAILTYPFDYI